ncbi:MAG: AraC family transcriptional regulator, partial [Chitinophagaceae bacterium]
MKHISILVANEAVLASITDPRYMFTAVNDFLERAGKEPLFRVQLVGLSKEVLLNQGSFSVHTDVLLKDVKKTDLVFVPALSGDLKAALEMNKEFVPWII